MTQLGDRATQGFRGGGCHGPFLDTPVLRADRGRCRPGRSGGDDGTIANARQDSDRSRHRGCRDGRPAGHRGGRRGAARGRTPSMLSSSQPLCSGSPTVFVRDRRRRLHGYPHSGRGRDDDRRPRDGAAGDAARLVLGGRRAPAVQLGALQRALCRRAWNRALVGRGAEALRDDEAGRGASAGHRGGSPGLRRRPDVLRPDASERGLLRRRPLDRGHLPRPGRHSPRHRHGARNPDLARAYERIAHLGTKGFYRGAIADAMVEAVQDPPTAADANHVWRRVS